MVGGRDPRQQPAGRSAILWLSVPNLFVLPFGTALGVYALWVLLHHEARTLVLGAVVFYFAAGFKAREV